MDLPRDAMLLRIFFGENDKYKGRPLYEAIVQRGARSPSSPARPCCADRWASANRAGCTRRRSCDLSEDLPLIVEIVDTEEKIKAFLPMLDPMMGSGLVTLEKVQVLQYGADVKHAPA